MRRRWPLAAMVVVIVCGVWAGEADAITNGAAVERLRVAGNAIGILRLPEGKDHKDNTDKGQCRPDTRNDIPPPCGIRSFFSSDGGAPLSAQIGGVVVFGLVTGIGIIVGIGGVIRRRLSGWAYLLGGLSTYALFLWWSSPA